MTTLKERVLEFLYKQVSENKIPTIRKGMVEDFERFVIYELAEAESMRLSVKMRQETSAKIQLIDGVTDETNS